MDPMEESILSSILLSLISMDDRFLSSSLTRSVARSIQLQKFLLQTAWYHNHWKAFDQCGSILPSISLDTTMVWSNSQTIYGFCKINAYLIINLTGKNLLISPSFFFQNDNLLSEYSLLRGMSNGYTMAVQRHYFQTIILYLKSSPCH